MNCGMLTVPTELFRYEKTFHCVDCLIDLMTNEIATSEFKPICTDCGREHRDTTHYGLCIDCFVAKRRTAILKMIS
jgi:hypothetical protein